MARRLHGIETQTRVRLVLAHFGKRTELRLDVATTGTDMLLGKAAGGLIPIGAWKSVIWFSESPWRRQHAGRDAPRAQVRRISWRQRVSFGQSKVVLSKLQGIAVPGRACNSLVAAFKATPAPSTNAAAESALADIDASLDGLPAVAKSAFLMRHVDGMEYAEIAAALRLSVSLVRVYVDLGLRATYARACSRG